MRAYEPGGRFDSDFERSSIFSGVDADLKEPVGTHAIWYIYDAEDTTIDPIYDVGYHPLNGVGGRVWTGPFPIPVVRAVISQGQSKISQIGFYNSDTLHLTINSQDIEHITPGVMENPDYLDRSRVIWKNEVWRPFNAQQRGIIVDGYILLTLDCSQVMPDEMVNDPQFQQYAL